MTEHIFEPIDNFGFDKIPQGEKLKVITDTEAVLNDLGVNSQLAKDVASRTKYLQPLLSLVYRRKPTDEDNIKREGRGVYHDKIPVAGREAIVYVKGIGNEGLIEKIGKERPFPGFPGDTERLVFDHLLTLSQHPRILGTETLPWGFLEYINSCVVFAAEASKQGWTKMEDALEAGVTVPIGMVHFKELSAYLLDLLQRRIKETPHELEAKQLEWKGNFVGLGSVGQIVPSDTRLPRLPNEELEGIKPDSELFNELRDTEKYRTAGRTLRGLLKLGIAYSAESSHGQNLYDKGLLAQGDNSDLIFLGDYIDCEVEDLFYGKANLSGREQRQAVIFRQLNRHDGLTPLAYPVPKFGISWENVRDAQTKFWTEFLGGVAHPDAIAQIPRLAPILREQVNLATSILAVRKLESPQWDKIASERKRVLKKFDRVGASSELESKIESNLPSYSTLSYRKMVSAEDVLGVQSMLKFLETGDLEHVRGDRRLGPYLQLAEAIYKIDDNGVRDGLLHQLGQLQLERDYSLVIEGPNVDVIDVFNNRHIELVKDLVGRGQYEKATKAIDNVRTANHWRLSETHPHSEAEYLMHYYPARLLEKDADIDELYEQAKFFKLFFTFQNHTTPGLLSAVMMSETTQRIDIDHYASENKVSNPRMILMDTLGAVVSNPENRRGLSGYMQSYEDNLTRLLIAQSDNERQEALGALNLLPQSDIGKQYPELAFVHNCTMAVYYTERDPSLAGEYYQKALSYYKIDYERRKKELGVEHDLWYTDNARAKRERQDAARRLKEKYSSLGFEKIASEYGK